MTIALRVLVLLLAALPNISANSFSPFPHGRPNVGPLAPQRSWYIKARNTLIEAAWKVSQTPSHAGGSALCREPKPPPKKVLAAYGDDLVLYPPPPLKPPAFM